MAAINTAADDIEQISGVKKVVEGTKPNGDGYLRVQVATENKTAICGEIEETGFKTTKTGAMGDYTTVLVE